MKIAKTVPYLHKTWSLTIKILIKLSHVVIQMQKKQKKREKKIRKRALPKAQ